MTIKYYSETKWFQPINTSLTVAPPIVTLTMRTRNINGPNTANYRHLKKRNLPWNPVALEVVTSGIVVSNDFKYNKDGSGKIYTTLIRRYDRTPFHSDNALGAAALRSSNSATLSNLGNMEVNLAQAFGERGQVVDMLASTARRFTACYRNLRRGAWQDAVKNLGLSVKYVEKRSAKELYSYKQKLPRDPKGAAAGFWLELQYGWKPLLSDIHGSAKLLADKHVADETDSFYALKHMKTSRTLNSHSTTTSLNAYGRTVNNFGASCKGTNTLQYSVSNPLLRYSAMMGMTNPLLLAWELTPFSFVVDWFLPIGNYLENISSAYGLTLLRRTVSTKSVGYRDGFSIFDTSGLTTFPRGIESSISGKTKYVSYNRSVANGWPANPLPEFKNPASVTRAANAIALLIQVFGGKR